MTHNLTTVYTDNISFYGTAPLLALNEADTLMEENRQHTIIYLHVILTNMSVCAC